MDLSAARPRIERLSEDLVNKIAAGEVVERPASVVKELVENALDAGAFNVGVELEAGGKTLIRVRDDGCGMSREDAQLAIERHATSKLRLLEDLAELGTHGFRGEALPAIASVAHLVLRTRDDSEAAGSEVDVKPGRGLRVRDAGHPRGTTVEVRDLFGAVPARRKFLRADATEAGNVAETVTLLALARPATGFQLSSGGRTLLRAPAADSLETRVYQLFGREYLDQLLHVDASLGPVRVWGLVARTEAALRSRAVLRLFVNGRPIRDRGLAKAVIQAYRGAGAGDARPEAILFVELPRHLVDVNVHPAKTEVRFADPRAVWTAVERAVAQALSDAARREAPLADASRVREAAERYLARGAATAPASSQVRLGWSAADAVSGGDAHDGPAQEGKRPAGEAPIPLGQHRNTYILATDGEDLLLVDQHTAHERVCFERLVERLATRSVESQGLLAPIVLTLPPTLLPVLEARSAELHELGFDLDGFGGGSVRVRAVPALLGAGDPERSLTRLLRDFLEREDSEWAVSGPRDRLAATLACHSAVRAGQPLVAETMAAILRDLARARHSSLCPHGRPTSVRIPQGEVARWFGRTGWRRR